MHKYLINSINDFKEINVLLQRVCILLGVVVVAFAAPQKPDAEIAIVKQDFDQQPDGSYRYRLIASHSIVICFACFNETLVA